MRVIGFRLFQVVFAIALLAIAFWPGWGLFYIAVANAGTSPYLVTIGSAIWIMLLGLNLPLTRRQFQYLGAICFLAVIVVVLLSLRDRGVFNEGNSDQLIITAIISGGIMLGWFTISSHIWRSYRGVYGVDDPDSGVQE
jgi:hypothetical protein